MGGMTLRRHRAHVLEVDRFSLAANNLGYAMLGDVLRSWDAYPSPAPGWGRVPVWGAAQVLEAPAGLAAVGATVTGYLPMATHAVVRVERRRSALMAVDEPRSAMLPIYHRLALDGTDPGWSDHHRDVDTVMLAVFRFAALLADDLRRSGVGEVVVSSASSRSAAALSHLLDGHGIEVTGLTSARNEAAVKTFDTYRPVLTYDRIDELATDGNAVYVDLAGAGDVTSAVGERLGARLVGSIVVGGTHLRSWPAEFPSATVFNTGDREVEVVAERGEEEVENLYRTARGTLVAWAASWLRVTTKHGVGAAGETWRDIAAGQTDPLSAVVLRP